jgi:hypothetical protein
MTESNFTPVEAIQAVDFLTPERAMRERDRIFNLVPAHSADKIAAARGMQVVPRIPGLATGINILCSNLVEVEEVVKRHNNPNAERQTHFGYGLDQKRFRLLDGREAVAYASGAEADGETSWPSHVHKVGKNLKGVYEHYWIISGEAEMEGVPMDQYTVVHPDTDHHIKAGPNGVAFLIITENTEGIPDNEIHHYPKR